MAFVRPFSDGGIEVYYLRAAMLVAAICVNGTVAQAGNLLPPEPEQEVQIPFEPAQGSVNGAYLLLAAFAIMAAAAASN